MTTIDESQVRVVGRVVKPHGVRGELVVDIRTDSVEQRFAAGSVLLLTPTGGAARQVTVTSARPHSGRLLVRLAEVDGREAADAVRGALLSASVADLPPIEDPDEFYDHQLEGLTVVTVTGVEVGRVRDVNHGAGGDLLVVDRTGGGEALVPFVGQIVPEVDLAAGRLVIDPPPGLLED
jgi:16S rRNA processing protein RimM